MIFSQVAGPTHERLRREAVTRSNIQKEDTHMLLENKNAVIYGAGGAIGGATARAFAREGARVFLTGHHRAAVESVAQEISAAGGVAEAAEVDALDEKAVEEHLKGVVQRFGHVDISFNAVTAVPQPGVQGIPLIELSPESFTLPITAYSRTNFLTARAAARRMVERKSGVILTVTAAPARSGAPLVGGMAPAWAALESLTRDLAAELGPHGVRVVCLRPAGIPETDTIGVVFGLHAAALGMSRQDFQAVMEGQTMRRRLQTLTEVANVAAFIASDQASAMTGTVANLSSGSIVD
jgi:NAD(P)-dependent dehydrogenase (short-subunit alcohol dehydrogenase family)